MMEEHKLRAEILEEIHALLKEVRSGTLDRKKLEAGLKRLEDEVQRIPPFKGRGDDDED